MAAGQRGARGQVSFERERGVYDLQVSGDVAHVVAVVGGEPGRTAGIQRVVRTLADEGIPIFLIKLHRTAVSFAVDGGRVPEVERCLQAIGVDVRVRRDLALVSVVASSMRDLTGVMVSIAEALHRAGARLFGVGDSHNSVQCLIDGAHVEAARQELRRTFHLESPHA